MSTPLIATVINMHARPATASHLCFAVDGILGELDAQLGTTVTPFPFETFYGNLGNTSAADLSRLTFDSTGIRYSADVEASILASLRAEPQKIALDRAINARQNAYFAKYAQTETIIGQIRTYYQASTLSAPNPGSKPDLLKSLSALAQQQEDLLYGNYVADSRTGVVKVTTSDLTSHSQTTGKSATTASGSQTGSDDASGDDYTTTENNKTNDTGWSDEKQTITNWDYGYRVPFVECQAQNARAQISLIDQMFSQFMFGQNLPKLEIVFANEQQSMDLGVRRLQTAYLDTILMSPVGGTVTGIYKNPGDPVRAGEPVVRVESNNTVYLVATLVCRGLIAIGNPVTVTTQLFDGTETPLPGTVVSARGHADQDDRWDVIMTCNNLDSTNNPILPFGYHFDYDDTSVTIG